MTIAAQMNSVHVESDLKITLLFFKIEPLWKFGLASYFSLKLLAFEPIALHRNFQ